MTPRIRTALIFIASSLVVGLLFQTLFPSNQRIIKTTGELGHMPRFTSVAFTQADGKPEQLLIRQISETKEKLDVAIYSITHPEIVKAIISAKKRGVAVRLVTDKQQSGGKTQKQALKLISQAGIPVKIKSDSGLMHLKMTITDNEVTIGSFNYSKNASTENEELLVATQDDMFRLECQENFDRMWSDPKFKDLK